MPVVGKPTTFMTALPYETGGDLEVSPCNPMSFMVFFSCKSPSRRVTLNASVPQGDNHPLSKSGSVLPSCLLIFTCDAGPGSDVSWPLLSISRQLNPCQAYIFL